MPNGDLIYRRGEIRWINLEPTVSAEARKTRACLIVQNDVGNRYSFLTVVIPLLPGTKDVPYVVNVKPTVSNGLDRDRYLDIGQIRGLDNSRVLGLVGVLENDYWEAIQAALNIALDFE
jgi:mRNA interferase MazF